MKTEILHKTDWLALLKLTDPDNGVNGYICSHEVWSGGQAVAVLPYRYSTKTGEEEYLLRQEVTPCWGMAPSLSAITGGMNISGESAIICAQRELHEETGYQVSLDGRWSCLGDCRLSKSSTTIMHLFAVKVAGLAPGRAVGDGTELEAKATCVWHREPYMAVDPVVSTMRERLFLVQAAKVWGRPIPKFPVLHNGHLDLGGVDDDQ